MTPCHASDPASAVARLCAATCPPGGNARLTVEVQGFIRYQGDWLGIVITPHQLDIWLLPGGGKLWGDIPAGQRRYLDLPGGTLPFTAHEHAGLGPYQTSPLLAPANLLADMAAARTIAIDGLRALFAACVPAPASTAQTPPAGPARRHFFRRLGGQRQS